MFQTVTFDNEKFDEVMALIGNRVPRRDAAQLIDGDWNNAADHQAWLNEYTPVVIADWIISVYNTPDED